MSGSKDNQSVGSTMSTGAPAPSDRHSLTIGPHGPILLHDVHFLGQMAHVNREKEPERQPHAKGSGAFGVFNTTEDLSAYTRSALFQRGASTEMLARFSTVAGEQGSPDTWRDVRGDLANRQRLRLSATTLGTELTRRRTCPRLPNPVRGRVFRGLSLA
jgi:catalase